MRSLVVVGLLTLASPAFAQAPSIAPPPPPSLEDRLDQCNADLGAAKQEAGSLRQEGAKLNYNLRKINEAAAAKDKAASEAAKKAEPEKK